MWGVVGGETDQTTQYARKRTNGREKGVNIQEQREFQLHRYRFCKLPRAHR